ncbi:hypothetical protein Hanom_Chr08g00726621 [Helianthus anomalus]
MTFFVLLSPSGLRFIAIFVPRGLATFTTSIQNNIFFVTGPFRFAFSCHFHPISYLHPFFLLITCDLTKLPF